MKGNRKLAVKRAAGTGTLLAAVLAFALTVLPAGQARADYLNLEQDMFLSVTPAEKTEELKEAGLVLDLYQVAAAVPVSGYDTYQFAATTQFAGLAEDVRNPDVTNDDWKNIAGKAAAEVFKEGSTIGPVVQGAAPKFSEEDAPISLPGGSGLYLVIARGNLPKGQTSYTETAEDGSLVTVAYSRNMKFTFDPQLVAVPGKPQYDSNNTADPESWLYDVPMTLKVGWEDREAELEIVKSLDVYETKDPATFVFQVEATEGGETIYSNVVSLVFDGPGTKTYPIKGLPVGAEVTVTEVYKGANYALKKGIEESQKVTLEADEIARTTFENTYDNTFHGGGSVVNEFTKKTSDAGNGYYDPTAKIKDEDQLEADKAAQ